MTKESPIKVLVASKSEHKIAAVKIALASVFPGRGIEVDGVKAPSDIQEQPLGLPMTTTGAHNRLKHALAEKQKEYDYVVSMESGIMLQKLTPRRMYVDKAVVIARNLHTKRSHVEVSEPVIFPLTAVKEARRRGFATTTVGAVLAEQNPGLDAADPHSFLTKGKNSCRDLLAAAVAKALEKV